MLNFLLGDFALVVFSCRLQVSDFYVSSVSICPETEMVDSRGFVRVRNLGDEYEYD